MSIMERILDFGFSDIDLWRSEEMQSVQLIIPSESAHDTVLALGEVGLLQFKDLNSEKSAFQRTYANQVKRCEEMARKLRFFCEQVEKAGIAMAVKSPQEKTYQLDELESKLEELEKEMVETNANAERLQRSHDELTELQLVLDKAEAFFKSSANVNGTSIRRSMADNADAPLLEGGPQAEKVGKIGFFAGLIPHEKLPGFERLLFRATRGNVYLKAVPVGKVRDPASGTEVEKQVFVIFYSGERSKAKISKICEVFGANRYPFPEDVANQRQMLADVQGRLRELSATIEAGDRHKAASLQHIAGNLSDWVTLVKKEKAVYHTLNKLSIDYTSKVLVAEAWVPTKALGRVNEVLRLAAEQSSTQLHSVMQSIPVHEAPPTFYRTNKFSSCFQTIVDAYGVAKYAEVNPTVYTLMTFPFLFAVMFGDFGHGLIMFFFGLFLVLREKQLGKSDLGDMGNMVFSGRYCILLMSIYSIYTGLIYNEFFSFPMEIFGNTRFRCYIDGVQLPMTDMRNCGPAGGVMQMPPNTGPYVFGVDPVWHGGKQELPYLNSYKMKLSILLGVTHMNLGILMSLFNNLYFRDTLSLVCEFIPQMIFMNCIFGYLCILIVAKWCSGSLADLYHTMIYMFLSPGSMDAQGQVFSGQGGLQAFLLLVAFFSVPWMLFPKPYILKKRHEAAGHAKRREVEMASPDRYGLINQDEDEESRKPAGGADPHAAARGSGAHGGGDHGHGEHFEFGEVIVHQMIHTIEFVLGAVSNTASYLRLWALSLAHSQLSAVFFDRVLAKSIDMNNVLYMFIGFFVFACATLGVLMVMESLSAFLHALRLHWVEYQNKFYKGDGYLFTPFSLEAVGLLEL